MPAIRTAIINAIAYCRIVRSRLLDRAPDDELLACTDYTERELERVLKQIDDADSTASRTAT